MKELLEKLNNMQKDAVRHISGPLLIMAGAGSGKTRTLTCRIAYLVKEKNVSPWNILAGTFTNKAANEMKQRVLKLLHPQLPPESIQSYMTGRETDIPLVGTFHSICVKILKKEIHHLDFENNFTIYDDADQQSLVKLIMKNLHIDTTKINPKAIISSISGAKNDLVTPEAYGNFVNNYFTEKVHQIYKEYQKQLAKNQALDFDDLIMKTIELFQQEPEILDKYQERFKFISVDEYQDTNHAQYFLIKILANKYRNLCVIGDSDQSIYSWRGADMRNILHFEKDYPDAKIILLEQNYRSSPIILEAAHEVIVKNKNRKEKKMWTEKEEGELIHFWTANNERHEGELIIHEIKKVIANEEYPNYSKFVILYRTNAQSRVLEEIFMKNAVPYKIVGGVKFYARKEVKDILSYLKLAQNPHDNTSLMRIINTPPRKIGPKTLEILEQKSSTYGLSLYQVFQKLDLINELSSAKKEVLKKFYEEWQDIIKANKTFPASGVIKAILTFTGYRDFLLKEGSEEGEIRFQNIQELITVANKYDALEPQISLATFLEEVSLISDIDQLDDKDNAVTMMTLHAAKGLEFPHVFIVGLEEGVFPHSRTLFDPYEMEEERRLMYVGMTRAMEYLYLIHARERQLYGENKTNAPSQFMDYIPEKLIKSNIPKVDLNSVNFKPIPNEFDTYIYQETDIMEGDNIYHPSFGEGKVLKIIGGIATISFRKKIHGIKKFALSVAPIT